MGSGDSKRGLNGNFGLKSATTHQADYIARVLKTIERGARVLIPFPLTGSSPKAPVAQLRAFRAFTRLC